MNTLKTVQFHGQELFLIEHNGEPYTPMKPIVEGMGLTWRTQQRKFAQNDTRWGMVMMTIPSAGGDQKALCMPLRKLPAYLSSINPKKVKQELRPRIEMYQAECDDALWHYWNDGYAVNPRHSHNHQETYQRHIDGFDFLFIGERWWIQAESLVDVLGFVDHYRLEWIVMRLLEDDRLKIISDCLTSSRGIYLSLPATLMMMEQAPIRTPELNDRVFKAFQQVEFGGAQRLQLVG
ncbi:MAG: phage antirepressor N-terminal domain-containing protein [Gammaproteobacteria bacterium]|nr:phage antirepressor N-terminal domain-containing protein [Gammaproteobacteria bacterium]